MTAYRSTPMLSQPLEDTALLRFPGLAADHGLIHAVTCKPWNLAPHRGPDRERAVERRQRVCAALGLDFDRLTAAEQIHGPHVVRVEESDVGAGRFDRRDAVRFVDGLVCDERGVPLLQLSADCPLMVVYDRRRPALGCAHASWRGTVAGIAEQLVAAMVRSFNSDPPALRAGIGPCAGPQRYEVGPEVRRVALTALPDAERFFSPAAGFDSARNPGRYLFDLRAANAAQLLRSGLRAEHIETAAECTISDPRFFSHRRDGDLTGRFGLLVALR